MAESNNETEQLTIANEKVLKKYLKAAEITNVVLRKLVEKCVVGTTALELCKFGDDTLLEGTSKCYAKNEEMKKGVAFPTCISINNCVCHFSPLSSEKPVVLADGDLVKIDLGCHLDGYIAVAAHTMVVGATAANPVTGKKADAVIAAYQASELALRLVRPEKENNNVTKHIQTAVESYKCKPIEGMLSHQLSQFVIDGAKAVIQNPTELQRREHEKCKFEVHEVYAMDVLISSGEGKGRESDVRTTVYKRKEDVTYNLKMKASRQFFGQVCKKFNVMPFSLRMMPEENKAKLGVLECMKHGLIEPFQVLFERNDEYVAQFKHTILLLPEGPRRITGLPFEHELYKSDYSIEDEELKTILSEKIDFKTAEERRSEAAAQAIADITAEMKKSDVSK